MRLISAKQLKRVAETGCVPSNDDAGVDHSPTRWKKARLFSSTLHTREACAPSVCSHRSRTRCHDLPPLRGGIKGGVFARSAKGRAVFNTFQAVKPAWRPLARPTPPRPSPEGREKMPALSLLCHPRPEQQSRVGDGVPAVTIMQVSWLGADNRRHGSIPFPALRAARNDT